MVLRNVTIDDMDTGSIHYSGTWSRGTYFSHGSGSEHGTISTAEDTSASFAFQYDRKPSIKVTTSSI